MRVSRPSPGPLSSIYERFAMKYTPGRGQVAARRSRFYPAFRAHLAFASWRRFGVLPEQALPPTRASELDQPRLAHPYRRTRSTEASIKVTFFASSLPVSGLAP